MSLRNEQSAFAVDTINLFQFILANGFEFTYGEALRTEYQQKEYLRIGRSKALISQHQKKLALDLNIFKDGKLCNADEIRIIGRYWESLNLLNRWGGSWRGMVEAGKSHFVDSDHFERQGG